MDIILYAQPYDSCTGLVPRYRYDINIFWYCTIALLGYHDYHCIYLQLPTYHTSLVDDGWRK